MDGYIGTFSSTNLPSHVKSLSQSIKNRIEISITPYLFYDWYQTVTCTLSILIIIDISPQTQRIATNNTEFNITRHIDNYLEIR